MSIETDLTKRDLLKKIGYGAGISAMYPAMAALGFLSTPSHAMPIKLDGAPKNSTVLVLGAGVAGLVAAYELRKAGYKVKILEYQKRSGGRAWSAYGGDKFTDLKGQTLKCDFDKGHYLNVGPWRIPYHHQNMLRYCKEFGVRLDPFSELNFNSYLYSDQGFGGKPRRYREVVADFDGYMMELLAKAVNSNALNDPVTKNDKEVVLAALKAHGVLDDEYRYVKGYGSSSKRGFEKPLGGGLSGAPEPSELIGLKNLLDSGAWGLMGTHSAHQFQQSMFEVRGGMDKIGPAFAKPVKDAIEYGAEVTEIRQSENGVEVFYKSGTSTKTAKGDWCVCTIPLPMLRRINVQVSGKMKAAIDAVSYDHVVKVGAQYKRRFWEQDDQIYGGVSLTTQPNLIVSYPSDPDYFFSDGKGVMLNAYMFGEGGEKFTAMTPDERVQTSLSYLEKMHPQVKQEYDNGYSMAWDLVPWIRGAYALWNDGLRQEHYANLAAIDNRLVLAGEHVSYMPGWYEGALTSSLDAITRLHAKATQV